MATEQLYRRCPAGCLRGEISEYEQGPNATHTSWCRVCNGTGYVPIDPPNAPDDADLQAAAVTLLSDLANHVKRPEVMAHINYGHAESRMEGYNEGYADGERHATANVPAIVAAARAAMKTAQPYHDDTTSTDFPHLTVIDTVAIDALREALASTVAPLTEEERVGMIDAIWWAEVAWEKLGEPGYASYRSIARDTVLAKLAELRPELAPYLGVGDA